MSGNELIKYIQENNLGEFPIMVGCQGYQNTEDEENETRIELVGDVVLIHDSCGGYIKD